LVHVVVVDGPLVELEVVDLVVDVAVVTCAFLVKRVVAAVVLDLSHWPLHHMEPGLIESVIHRVSVEILSSHPRHVRLDPTGVPLLGNSRLFSWSLSVPEVDLALAHVLEVLPWCSVRSALRAFLSSWVGIGRGEGIVLIIGPRFASLLLEQNSVELHVAVVHDQVLGHESLQLVAVNHVEGTVVLQASHQVSHTVLVLLPFFLVLLDLNLGVR